MHVGGCGFQVPETLQVLEINPNKCSSESHINETTVFTRYLPLDSAEEFTWPFNGVGSAQVTTNLYKFLFKGRQIVLVCRILFETKEN